VTPKVARVITVLCGGVGAARLLCALREVTDPALTTAIVNVGDDTVMHGLTICPDLDTVSYTLAGRHDVDRGWGLAGETWQAMGALAELGGDAWFRLGDRDLGTHLYRTQRLAQGATKSRVAAEIAHALGVPERILPVTDDPLATTLDTDDGVLSFQEYFVGRRHDVVVRSVRYDGAAACTAAAGVLEAIASARRVVIAPSNPVLSIAPLLAVPGVRDAIAARRADVVAVSPIIAGSALKGPADRIMRELGLEVSSVGVAQFYAQIAGAIVIDERDAALADRVAATGVTPIVTTTVMALAPDARRLAAAVAA
jgi:LPPG:FO 2-phospho-L-lactate transferase